MSTSKFRVLRTCEFCGKEFYAQKVTTRFCSRRCNELAYKQRRRQRQITEAEAKVQQKPIEEVGNKEFLSLQDTSVLFGITKRSVYNLIYNRVLQAFRLSSRMTLIRRSVNPSLSFTPLLKLRKSLAYQSHGFSRLARRRIFQRFSIMVRPTGASGTSINILPNTLRTIAS